MRSICQWEYFTTEIAEQVTQNPRKALVALFKLDRRNLETLFYTTKTRNTTHGPKINLQGGTVKTYLASQA